ncbi:uncharacterized protein LOC132278356 [Cornus florida]|uniref:uncharacterized protein LOC132278356 n=1 Tax=Cornus florida TaxID=4283 RepID=UPI0028996856|nr:uncharacterized protein LOC132278356 [Cornus florida]
MDINVDNVVGEEIEDLIDNTDDGKLVWDDSQVEAFIICMEEEVKAGNRSNTTFSAIGWKNILKGETNMGFNAETGMVIVEKERWSRLIKVNAQYSKYRKKPCNHFDKLTTIFGGTHAAGVHVHTSYNPPIMNQAPAHHAGIHNSFNLNDDFAELGGHEFSPFPESRGKKPKRKSFAFTMSELMTIIDLYDDGDEENDCVIVMACMLEMSTPVFLKLCGELQSLGLKDSTGVSVYEQVGIFLLTLGHNEGNRVVAERFQHSTYTISKYFHAVLQKVCNLGKQIIVAPDFSEVPNHIKKNKKYHPFFRHCVGAIDGTHVHANVPVDQQIPFHGRKGDTTQNVMVVCDFNMMFTYVVAGWKGSANDSKILNKTINNEDLHFPMPPDGKYYLVDSGYANQPGFLAPYKGQQHHFQEYRRASRQPQGREEIYNHRHSSLRNIIERCFGFLKIRFPILKQMPPYKFEAQVAIVLACCTLHNFIRN